MGYGDGRGPGGLRHARQKQSPPRLDKAMLRLKPVPVLAWNGGERHKLHGEVALQRKFHGRVIHPPFGDGVSLQFVSPRPSGEFVIPEQVNGLPVRSIEYHFCYENEDITSLRLPSTLRNIDASAFNNCTSLHELSIPSTVTHIGMTAFYSCAALTSVTYYGSLPELESTNIYGGSTSENRPKCTSYVRLPTSGWDSALTAGRGAEGLFAESRR